VSEMLVPVAEKELASEQDKKLPTSSLVIIVLRQIQSRFIRTDFSLKPFLL